MRGAKKYLAGLITSILVANCSWLGGSKELAEYKALLEQSNLPPQTQEVEDKSYIYLSRKVGDTYVELKINPSRHNVRIDLSPKKEKESIIEGTEKQVQEVKLYVKVLETLNQIDERLKKLAKRTKDLPELRQKLEDLSNQTAILKEEVSRLNNATSKLSDLSNQTALLQKEVSRLNNATSKLPDLSNQTALLQKEVVRLNNATSSLPQIELRLESLEAQKVDLIKLQQDVANLKQKLMDLEALSQKVNQLEETLIGLKQSQEVSSSKFLEKERQQLEEYIFYFDQAQKLFALGKYQKALEMVNKAIALFPDLVIAYKLKGSILYRMGNVEEAKKVWQKVIELDPNAEDVKQFIEKLEKGEISVQSIKKMRK
jgi:tetratricopeptide (TPR) repeat protein